MSRYIDAEKIEYHEVFEGHEFVRVAYGDDIDELPTADVVERKHGEWAEEGYCPFCKCDMPAFIEDWEWKRCRTPYCPNCGASMERGEEDV